MKPPLLILTSTLVTTGCLVVFFWSGSEDQDPSTLRTELALETPESRLESSALRESPFGEGQRVQIEVPEPPPVTRTTTTERTPEPIESLRESQAEARAQSLEQRRLRIELEIQQRSVRIADELQLGTGAEVKIAEVYLEERDKLEQLKQDYNAGLPTREARAKLREGLDGMKSWRHERFTTLYGREMARAIDGFEDRAAIESANLRREDTDE